MGGMFDAKQDKIKRKQELAQKEEKARTKRRRITITVVVVFVLAVSVAMLLNSNWLRRTLPVVTVDGKSFSAAEFEFFYENEYLSMASQFEQQGMGFLLPDRSRSLSSQMYSGEETWADYLTNRTLESMQDLVSKYNSAKADGYELSQEHLTEIDEIMSMAELEATLYGYPSAGSYLQGRFGVGMTMAVYRDMLELVFLADNYITHIRNSFEYTDEQVDAYYEENADRLDIYRFRVFTVTAQMPSEDAEDYDAEMAEALEAAREAAEGIAQNIVSEDSFIMAAFEYDGELYEAEGSTLHEVQGVSLTADFSVWLSERGRASGDITTVDAQQGTSIVFFLSRDDNNYRTVNMRQLLFMRDSISPDDYPEGENDPDYTAAVELAADDARERAESTDREFTDAGRTEDALLGLMEKSDDTTEGGLYEGISKYPYQGMDINIMRVVPELEAWLFDDDRAIGDSLLIETEAYGFHLLYFTGHGELFYRLMIDDILRTEEFYAWLDSLPVGEAVRHGAFILVNT